LALRELLGNQNVILQADDTISIRNYVGFIARGKTRLQILPKIFADQSTPDSEIEKTESVNLLLRLLSYSGFISNKEIPDPQSIEACNNDLFEIFVNIFISQFLRLFRRDVHRCYESCEENQQFIKGKILFHRSILHNSLQKHKHYVHYDEFTSNTLLNRIFKTVIILLLSQTIISENKKNLRLALCYLEEVETIGLYKGIFSMIRFNRLNDAYRPLFTMARLFYHNRQPGFSDGDEYTFTFLVPLNKLFEYFVYKLILNFAWDKEVTVNHESPQKNLANCDGSGYFPLKPDITVYHGVNALYILDAKFKNPLGTSGGMDLTATDVYQIVTYSVCYKCDDVFLVYPYFRGNSRRETELAQYQIPTLSGNIKLKILQVDILESDIVLLQSQLVRDILSRGECRAVETPAHQSALL
jgi:5-methylcytosine-specific restriction enzyme subunit McrC